MGWVKVACASEVQPGCGKAVIVDRLELALFCIDGEYYCIENICPHMGGPLSEGDLNGDVVHCPWHYWPFNVRTGELTFNPSIRTSKFNCRVEGDDILVDVGERRVS